MSHPLLIIGAGPVGLTMACELVRFGVPVRIIDKNLRRTDKSKALVIWPRTLELMDRSGVSSALIAAGQKVVGANITAGASRIAHIAISEVPSPHAYALMLPQSETERILEEHLQSLGVRVERETELLRFAAAAENVGGVMRRADGREEDFSTPWLLGCDGAHSAVRHGLGMDFEGSTLMSDWILADVEIDGETVRCDEVHTFWHADGAMAMFPMSATRFRIVADVGDVEPGADPHPDPTLEQVQSIVDRRGPRGPGGMRLSQPHWLASFRINERKVRDYRAGRVFLAGDAAHIHSPAGGQGMNTGMQDAINLSWKLALVHQGLAGAEPLLGSYSIERSAVGKQVLADAGRLTALAVMRNRAAQTVRNHVASLVFGFAAVDQMMARKLTELAIGYPKSPLARAFDVPKHGPRAGERAPVQDVGAAAPAGAGARPRFALHAPERAQTIAFIREFQDVMEPKQRQPFDDDVATLVRPDGYVAATAKHDDLVGLSSWMRTILSRPSVAAT